MSEYVTDAGLLLDGSAVRPDEMFCITDGIEMDAALLEKYIAKHRTLCHERYMPLHECYQGDYPILHQAKKEAGKPDNRIIVNFAKYLVDTMNGFFIGTPIKVSSQDEQVAEYLNFLDKYNDQHDNNSELSKICSIYGKGYELYWEDENSNISITYLSPLEGFMIYDYSIVQQPLWFVTLYFDEDGTMHGTVYDDYEKVDFTNAGGLHFIEDSREPHYFDGIPASEYIENEERIGLFEPVYSLMNAYNKALSEKANDVEYFSDSYMKIVGPDASQEDLTHIRQNRIINYETDDPAGVQIEFMSKPSADAMQENLINRLTDEIYAKSMVMNIMDENFGGNASGISLKYKLFAMSNLAKAKERKFTSGLNRRYKIIFSNPLCPLPADAWMQIDYKFSQNFPANTLEEAQTAAQLAGITSRKTQLSALSIVTDVDAEMALIEAEEEDAKLTVEDVYPDFTHSDEPEEEPEGSPAGEA